MEKEEEKNFHNKNRRELHFETPVHKIPNSSFFVVEDIYILKTQKLSF